MEIRNDLLDTERLFESSSCLRLASGGGSLKRKKLLPVVGWKKLLGTTLIILPPEDYHNVRRDFRNVNKSHGTTEFANHSQVPTRGSCLSRWRLTCAASRNGSLHAASGAGGGLVTIA
jgi:hypothetical protein